MARKDPLDHALYALDENELAFLRAQTGIQDQDALKHHVLTIQAEAYEVRPYPCIRLYSFAKIYIARHFAYTQLLQLGRERDGATFLDIGCGFGNDVRKAAADGYPSQGIVASDLEPQFWQLGHRLFRSSAATFSVPFIPGDAFDTAFLRPVPPANTPATTPVPALSSLTHLTPLLGHVSAIYASALFHLFDEAGQLQLARSLAGLLSPQPGSLIFGAHHGRPEKGLRVEQARPLSRGNYMFCHSPESWMLLWDGEIFKKGTVRVETSLKVLDRADMDTVPGAKFHWLVWSVTRL